MPSLLGPDMTSNLLLGIPSHFAGVSVPIVRHVGLNTRTSQLLGNVSNAARVSDPGVRDFDSTIISSQIIENNSNFVGVLDPVLLPPLRGVQSVIYNNVGIVRMKPGFSKASILDFVAALTGNDYIHNCLTIRRLQANPTPRTRLFWLYAERYTFCGIDEREQYVLTPAQCIELMMQLPGSGTREFKQAGAGLLKRIFVQNPTIHHTLWKAGLSTEDIDLSSRSYMSRLFCLPVGCPSPWKTVIPHAREIYS
jgi:hypothetical protein